MGRLVGRSFTVDLQGSSDAIWAAMADTARYNESAGLPRHEITEIPQADGTVLFLARGRQGPFQLEWEDFPCNWVRGRWFEHRRRFRRGPLRWLNARFELGPSAERSRAVYRIEVEPKGLAGRALLLGGLIAAGGRMFKQLAAQADRFATGRSSQPFTPPPPRLAERGRERLDGLARELDVTAYGHGLGAKLATLLAEGSEEDVRRIRPLEQAERWAVPARHAVEACLQATRLGLLELRWDLLCPRCRGAKATTASLDRLPTGAHCGTCNVDYGRDFSQNVELTFQPAAALRSVSSGEFCLMGPMSSPHILAHVTVEPGGVRELDFTAAPGLYRVRTLEAGRDADIRHDGGGFPALEITADGIDAGAPAAPDRLHCSNATPRRRTVIVEERGWIRHALTADRLTTFQAFRDLFSAEVLRPGDEVAIRRVTLLFSDLKGSTALYEAIGDAAAYHLVRDHFAYLATIIREHDGCIVKTIGDAVMAAFHDPLQGYRAAVAMQERIEAFNADAIAPIVLKLGLHDGPSIAVTLNDRLDYFGSTVNLAARLQGESEGGDIVLSAALAQRIERSGGELGYAALRQQTAVRGIAGEVAFLRIAIGADPAARSAA